MNRKERTQRIRLQNLDLLIEKYETISNMCKKISLSENRISQFRTKYRGITDAVADKIEGELELPGGWLDQDRVTFSEISVSSPSIDESLDVYELIDARECGPDYIVRLNSNTIPGRSDSTLFRVTKWENDPDMAFIILRLEGGAPVLMQAQRYSDVFGATVRRFAPLVMGKAEPDPEKWYKPDLVEVLGALHNPVADPHLRTG